MDLILVNIVTKLRDGKLGFVSHQWLRNFLLATASRLDLRSTQPPIEVFRFFLWVVRRPGLETDHSHPFSAEVKNTWSYTSS
jgi:hypothetical protein